MSSTSATGLPVMTSGDAPNIPADVGINLAGALDTVTVPLFASTSARDAAYATKPFGLCFVGTSVDAGTLYRRRGGSWYEIKDIGSLVGPVITTDPGIAWGAGFSYTACWLQQAAGIATIFLQFKYTGSTITANATTGDTANVKIATLPAGWRLSSAFPVSPVAPVLNNQSQAQQAWNVVIGVGGDLSLANATIGGATINNNDDLRIFAQYPVAT